MKQYKIFAAIILIGFLWACEKTEPIDEYETVPEISSSVNTIAIDKNNTKWIGTNEGLYRSVESGYQLMDLSVKGEIHSLFYDKSDEKLWIGTEAGLINAVISSKNIEENLISNENLSDKMVLSFHFDSDSKHWFGTQKGITLNYEDVWKNEKFRINSSGDLFSMTIENFTINSIASWDGDYYFATSGAKLYRAFGYDETVDAFTGATQWDPPYNGLAISDTMFVVYIDNEGQQWMGGKEGIQVHKGHDPKNMGDFTYYYDELPDYYVFTINQAQNSDIWIGTRNGIGVFDGSNWKIIIEGLPDLQINTIAFDEDGSAWVGTKKGLVHIN